MQFRSMYLQNESCKKPIHNIDPEIQSPQNEVVIAVVLGLSLVQSAGIVRGVGVVQRVAILLEELRLYALQ